MCIEDLDVVSERTRLSVDPLKMALELFEVGLANRSGIHIEGVFTLESHKRRLDIEVERKFAVIEHGQEHGIVTTVAQSGERAAQSLWIAQEVTQDHEERAVGGLGKELIDARPGREARLHWLG